MSERFDKIVRQVGTRASGMGEREKGILQTFLDEYPEDKDVSRVIVYANADFTDPEDAPSGVLTVHSLDAAVQPDSLPDQMFQYMVVCPIKDDISQKGGDSYFSNQEQKLQEHVVQYAENPPSLEIRDSANRDTRAWDAELGTEGSFAGVYKQGRMPHGDRDEKYFIVVQASVPLACKQLKSQLVASKEPITFGQLLNDPKFAYVKNLAQRNAERLAYQVARTLGVRIQHVKDVSSYQQASHIAPPFRASPPVGNRQTVTGIKEIIFKGDKKAGVFNNLRSTAEGSESTFVNAGPYNGIVVFQMRGTGKGFGLPTSTGKRTVNSNMSRSDAEKRSKGIVWEGKGQNIYHKDLHPEAFRTVDDQFLESMKNQGWRQTGNDNRQYLLPVLLKIANPELKR